jgi:DNA-binding HxlR family transcriptional regulator
MVLLELLGRRWILRILWELRAESLGFRALQARCEGMSPSVLSRRLQDLASARIVEQDEDGNYRLSAPGARLLASLLPLHKWAEDWAQSATNLPPAGYSSPKRRSGHR